MLLAGAVLIPLVSVPGLLAADLGLLAIPFALAISATLLCGVAVLHVSGSRRLSLTILTAFAAGLLALIAGAAGSLAAILPTAGAASAATIAFAMWSGRAGSAVGKPDAADDTNNDAADSGPAPADMKMAESPSHAIPAIDMLPGFVMVHDGQSNVTQTGGLDRALFAEWDEGAGLRFADRLHVQDRLLFLQAVDALRQGESHVRVEMRLMRSRPGRHGHVAHLEADLVALRGETGAFEGFVTHLRQREDVAALRAERDRLKARAGSALAEKTRFLAAASHEMRTPLNAIIGFSDILARDFVAPLPDRRQREYVDMIHQSGEHLLSLVNSMLDMSRIETGNYCLAIDEVDVAALAEDCRGMLALEARKKKVDLVLRLGREPGSLRADRRALKQVLINLVGNAIKFTDAGGVISLDAVRTDTSLRLSVSDTGIGMAQDVLNRLGEPFLQGESGYDRSHQGTGLGLCLVKSLVALHGGTLAVDSVRGRGTTVTVELPLDGGQAIAETNENDTPFAEFPPRLTKKEQGRRYGGEEGHEATAKTA